MRYTLVIDSRSVDKPWSLYEVKEIDLDPDRCAKAVRDMCIEAAEKGHLAWDGQLRYRAFTDLTVNDAYTATRDNATPAAEHTYDALARFKERARVDAEIARRASGDDPEYPETRPEPLPDYAGAAPWGAIVDGYQLCRDTWHRIDRPDQIDLDDFCDAHPAFANATLEDAVRVWRESIGEMERVG